MITGNDLNPVDIFTALTPSDKERFAAKAADLRLQPQEWLLHEGEPSGFYVLLEGTVEMFKDLNGRRQRLHSRSPFSYFGEMPIILGTTSLVSIQAEQACRLARFDRQQLQEMIRDCPSFGEAIFQRLIERMKMVEDYAKATPSARVLLRGYRSDPQCHAIRAFLFANRVQYEWHPQGDSISSAASALPPHEVVVDGLQLAHPASMRMVAEALGLQTTPKQTCYDLVIVGAGPAGMAAAVYGASEGLSTLLVERSAVGGQAGTSSRIENYLGFPGGISGDDLSGRALHQAQRFGAEITVTRHVTAVHKKGDLFQVTLDASEVVTSKTVLLALGVEWRLLEAQGIDRLLGRGVFYGASRTEAMLLRGQRVYLVGGGNSAGQAAMFLSSYAAEVHLLVRGPGLAASMSRYLIDQLQAKENIVLHPQTTVHSVNGQARLESITTCRQSMSGNFSIEEHAADALFIMIGAKAQTSWLPASLERDASGYICTGQQIGQWNLTRPPYALETNIPGLFCAGDVRCHSIKRVASSVGEGSMAVSFIHQYLGLSDWPESFANEVRAESR